MTDPRPGRGAQTDKVRDQARPPLSVVAACAGTFLIAMAAYARTAAPTVYALDSAGLTRAAVLLRPAHQPGYPLYVVLGKVFTLALPTGDMAWRLNMMSAFFAALTLAILVGLLWALGCRLVVAVATAMMLGGSYYFWSVSTMAEVYSLQAFLTVSLLLSLVLWAALDQQRWALLAVLILGLAASNHVTIVLLAPGIAGFIWLARSPWLPTRKLRLAALVLTSLGPALYLLLPLRGSFHSLGDLAAFALALDFWPAVFAYTPAGYAHELAATMGLVWANFLGAGVVLGLAGLAMADPGERPLVALAGGGFLAGLLFFSGYHVADKGLMLAPFLVLWAVLIGRGASHLLTGLEQVWPSAPARLGLRLSLLIAASLVWGLNFPLADLSQDRRVRDKAEAVLAGVAPNATVLALSWVDLQPLLYLQEVEGMRPDVVLVDGQSADALGAVERNVATTSDTRPVYTIGRSPVAAGGQTSVWLPECGCYQLMRR